jgi:hypothetical protein
VILSPVNSPFAGLSGYELQKEIKTEIKSERNRISYYSSILGRSIYGHMAHFWYHIEKHDI